MAWDIIKIKDTYINGLENEFYLLRKAIEAKNKGDCSFHWRQIKSHMANFDCLLTSFLRNTNLTDIEDNSVVPR